LVQIAAMASIIGAAYERRDIAGNIEDFWVIVPGVCVVKLDNHPHDTVDDDRNCKRELDIKSLGVRGAWERDWVREPWEPLWSLGQEHAAGDTSSWRKMVLAGALAIAHKSILKTTGKG
jgi:hypothetical protein